MTGCGNGLTFMKVKKVKVLNLRRKFSEIRCFQNYNLTNNHKVKTNATIMPASIECSQNDSGCST